MPHGKKTRANARRSPRPEQRQVHTRGGVVAERPGRTRASQLADSLSSVAGAVGTYAERKAKEQEEEEAKQQQLQAYKDFHSDQNNEVSREEAQQRQAFGNDTYAQQYMRLSYAEQAGEISKDVQKHAQDMLQDPDTGIDEVEQYIDATTSGAIQGIDDPEAVDVFANRLTSDAEQLKSQARKVAVARQQQDGVEKFNARVDEVVDNDELHGRDGIEMMQNIATRLNISQEKARGSIANALFRKAAAEKDPSVLDPLFAEDDNGVSLADDPEIRDKAYRARDKIEAEAEQQTTAAELKQRYALQRKVETGSLTMGDIQQVNQDHPDWYTPNQLASMLSQSKDVARKESTQRREAAAMTAGRVSPVAMRMKTHSEQQKAFSYMRQGILGQHSDTPEDRQQAFMIYATRVAELSGGVSGVRDDWLAAQLNAGAEAPSSDGSMPEGFRAGYARYKALKSDPQTRGLLDNMLEPDARRMYQRVEAYEQSGDYLSSDQGHDLTPAYAKAKHDLANPIDEDTFYNSESFGRLRETVNSVTDVSSFLGWSETYGGETGAVSNALDVKHDIRQMATREMRYSRASLDQALATAKQRYKATHTLVRGTYIRGNYGSNADQIVNAKLADDLPAIQQTTGDGVEMDDLTVMANDNGKIMVMVNDHMPAMVGNGQGGTKPLVFNMAEARDAYADKVRSEVNAETPTASEAKAARPAPPPSGSPASLARQLDDSHEAERDRMRRGLSDTWQTVVDKLSEERDPQPTTGNPAKLY